MLREETVERGTLDLIRRLMADEQFNDFNLVGGTALALKIGHRKSVDIDLFTSKDFDSGAIAAHLDTTYHAQSLRAIKNGVFCFVNDVKVDLVAHKFPLVKDVENVAGVRMNSLLDIGAMKLNAIYNSGRRLKDFVDVYALLAIFPLKKLIEAGERKYDGIDGSMLKNSLIYFKDIDFRYPVDFIGKEIKWPEIEGRLKNAFQNPEKVFGRELAQAPKELEKKRSRRERKGKGLGM